ncbi:hypothetical protein [Lentibacillus cibarius]|uniref:Uncharacterized protein n=1 Tax=Lentibacillus cibarius TaxID=2583219 RepID=A0A5S3QNT7_9BACI|nr:hypothetical protein [Lentibacillus cibarius]TMN22176.1 hypothetical protein FFL34_08580 [Lentibacillus cibarius]
MMAFMNNRKGYLIIAIIIAVTVVVSFSSGEQQLYGNDKSDIKQVIKSVEGYENKTIHILEIKDIQDNRLVAFLSNGHPAYMQFWKNPDGNYKWQHVETSEDGPLAPFLVHLINHDVSGFIVVTNQENEAARMEIEVNGQTLRQPLNVHKYSVNWIKLPEANDGSYTLKYRYYDDKGNVLRDY